MELKDRKRSFDINRLSAEEVDNLSKQIGDKVKQICDEAVEKANKILNVYGMSAKMQILMEHEAMKGAQKPKAKRGRRRKDANL
jgi:hypothetical protein